MDLATTLLRPVARARLRRVQSELSLLPTPSNAARQSAGGSDVDRVLVFGNGPATGFGVRSQELGLPGQLARALARSTGRGVEVDLGRGRGMTVESTPKRLEQMRLWRYDAVIVTLGATDAGALLALDRWERALRDLIDSIRARTTPTTPVVLTGIRPIVRLHDVMGSFDLLTARHAGRMEAVSARLAGDEPHTRFVALEPAVRSIGADRYFSPESYRMIAEDIAAVLAPELDHRHATGEWLETRRLRDGAEPEERRQRAVDDLGVTTRPASARLERLVQSASDLFGTAGAAVTILDGDRMWNKAAIGMGVDELPRRVAICDQTIQRDGALLIADASADPATAEFGLQIPGGPLRFYAGYPIESPDGYRLGALCVFDHRSRDVSSVDQDRLRDLAMRIQNELWDEAGWTPAI